MATDGSICVKPSRKVGSTYQREDKASTNMHMAMDAGNVSETDSTVTFSVHGQFTYSGYNNLVLYRAGYLAYKSDGTYANLSGFNETYINQTASGGPTYEVTGTFTITKPDYLIGILPVFQVAAVLYGSSDYNAGNLWTFGNTYGCLIMNGDVWGNAGSGGYTSQTWTVNRADTDSDGNKLKQTLYCFGLYGVGTDTTASNVMTHNAMSYANTSLRVRTPAIYVYNSSGKPVGTNEVYVYNSSGVPVRASSVSVYGSDGKPHTIDLC